MANLFQGVYKDKRVLVTGHTGFKGSWLAFWLKSMGANVLGYSVDIPSTPCHFQVLDLDIQSVTGDVRHLDHLDKTFSEFKPHIVFHLAAQPLVLHSYKFPVETFETNVLGTVNVFEASRNCDSVQAVVNITSDKAYENTGEDIAFKETDKMGGYDPYSASKGCAELVVNSYRNSFFNNNQYKSEHSVLLASARAGNVIGGGDWAKDRLIPDVVMAAMRNEPAIIRNPGASRPWQHVLEPLSGYLLLGRHLLQGNVFAAEGWNFGPDQQQAMKVDDLLGLMKQCWDELQYELKPQPDGMHEAAHLRLDSAKAIEKLEWQPVWDTETAIKRTASWYKAYYSANKISTASDLRDYITEAKGRNLSWTN